MDQLGGLPGSSVPVPGADGGHGGVRPAAEPRLDEALTRLDMALEMGGLGLWDWDASSDRVWVSSTLERMLGLPVGGFDGLPSHLLGLVHPDDVDEVAEVMRMSIEVGPEWRHAFRMRRTDGEYRWFDSQGRAVLTDDGDLARVVGVAADVTERRQADRLRAELTAERDAAVRALEHTLLPPDLPAVAGLDLAARYAVAEAVIETGGDFYDVFPFGEGTWAVVLGDVSGRGPAAAALTGLVRHTVRALARRCAGVAELLTEVNEVLVDQIDEDRFCTAVVASVCPGPAGVEVVMANAGHPRPYLVGPDGAAIVLPVTGTLLGVAESVEVPEHRIDLAGGWSLVLVTDGVTEARNGDEELGEDGVVAALGAVGPGASADGLAGAVVGAASRFGLGRASDDRAVLVVRAADRGGRPVG